MTITVRLNLVSKCWETMFSDEPGLGFVCTPFRQAADFSTVKARLLEVNPGAEIVKTVPFFEMEVEE